MIGRSFIRSALALMPVLACVGMPGASHALEPLSPTRIFPMTYASTLVQGCRDGAQGRFVVWRDDSLQTVRALHLLPSGDVDPAWPYPATVCSVATARPVLGVVADELGGVYVWWLEGAAFVLARVGPDGRTAAGWPARGRIIQGAIQMPVQPTVISDGAHGVYVGYVRFEGDWLSGTGLAEVLHIGADNRPAGGWPAVPFPIGFTGTEPERTWAVSLALARAVEGGVWASVGMVTIVDTPAGWVPGDWRLLHLCADGRTAPGWDDFGVVLRSYLTDSTVYLTNVDPWRPERLAAILPDGQAGVLVVLGVFDSYYTWAMVPRLFSRDSHGGPRGSQGMGLDWTYRPDFHLPSHRDDDYMHVTEDGRGGFLLGKYEMVTDHDPEYSVQGYSGSGAADPDRHVGALYSSNVAYAPTGSGGFYLANNKPSSGECVYGCCVCATGALLEVQHSELGVVYSEHLPDPNPLATYFGDLALISATAESPWLVWSQVRDRPPGLYLMQLPTAPGPVCVPDPPAAAARFTARFAPGRGVLVRGVPGANGEARLLLADVAGRAIASERVPAGVGAGEWRVPGTASLPAGLYFARITSGRAATSARVIVIR